MSEAGQPNAIAVAPYFLVADIHHSVRWYREKLGFKIDKLWGEPPVFTIAQFGAISIMLKQSSSAPGFTPVGPDDAWNAYVWVRDIRAIEKTLRDNSVEIIRGPEKTPYDCEEIEIRDPDGHVICFGACW